MKRIACCVALLSLALFSIVGCGGEEEGAPGSGSPAGGKTIQPTTAADFDDGAEKYAPKQGLDPVVTLPIQKQYYYDYQGKRIYFSSEKSIEKFKQNPQKYLNKLPQ